MELKKVIRKIISGEEGIAVLDKSWDDTFAGTVRFVTETWWVLDIFNDCDSLDYLEGVITPEGQKFTDDGNNRYWMSFLRRKKNNFDLNKLEKVLKSAPVITKEMAMK